MLATETCWSLLQQKVRIHIRELQEQEPGAVCSLGLRFWEPQQTPLLTRLLMPGCCIPLCASFCLFFFFLSLTAELWGRALVPGEATQEE